MLKRAIGLGACLAVPAAASGQYLMVTDWTDRVVLLDAQTGAVVNENFIVDEGPGGRYDIQSPRQAIQVGDEIWVSDQLADAVFRFTAGLTPAYVATVTGGLDNVRGLAVLGNEVFVANAQTGNGAPGEAIVVVSSEGVITRSFPTPGQVMGIAAAGTELLVGVTSGGAPGEGDDIRRYAPGGGFLGDFYNGPGTVMLNDPAQLFREGDGSVLVAGSASPRAIHRFDGAGVPVASYPATGFPRGVWRLGNGRILYTQGSRTSTAGDGGIWTIDPATGGHTSVLAGDTYWYVGPLDLAPPCVADFDRSGAVDVGDIFAYLSAWFGGAPGANVNGDGAVDVADIFAYLSAWFAGCP